MTPFGAIVVIAAVLVGFCAVYFAARNETVWRHVVCPLKGKPAEVEVVRRFEGRKKPVRIRSCDLLDDPRKVTCAQHCLKIVPR